MRMSSSLGLRPSRGSGLVKWGVRTTSCSRAPVDLLERGEDPDVRVEIGDRVDPGPRQQVPQQPRLDRGRELHHVVGGGHPLGIGQADLIDGEQLERLVGGVDEAGRDRR